MSVGGKGSKRRRSQVSYHQFSTNWDTIFGKKQDQYSEVQKQCCQENKCCNCNCDPSTCCCQKYE